VASLARPGGNVTGLSVLIGEGLAGKWVDLLKEAAPNISRIAYMRDASNPLTKTFLPDIQTVARALGVTAQALDVHKLAELMSLVK
jgi:putative ABC transport system substrate-binding protein